MQTVCNTYWDAGKGNLTAQNTRKPFGGRGAAPGSLQRSRKAPSGGEGLAAPSPRTPSPLSAFRSSPLLPTPKLVPMPLIGYTLSCGGVAVKLTNPWAWRSGGWWGNVKMAKAVRGSANDTYDEQWTRSRLIRIRLTKWIGNLAVESHIKSLPLLNRCQSLWLFNQTRYLKSIIKNFNPVLRQC